ncbi:MAG: nitrous oxide reductase accessory protein NosL [Fibrobacteria bacterium]
MILVGRKEAADLDKGRSLLESLLLVLAGIALLASLFFPMWRITLDAPQYPEGMGMQIWTRTIVGENPHDLDIINELNHYIGMKKIVPESIPELRFIMPLTLLFAFLCFIAAFRPKAWSTGALLSGLTGLGAYGMYDFWNWEYDYGHDLNPMAAIKVPGMSYQPPLIGEAKLLNFLSTSWPALGGYLLFLGGVLIALSLAVALSRSWGWKIGLGKSRIPQVTAAVLTLGLLFSGCGRSGPVVFHWGEDACHFCKMTLVQKGFAAQRINEKGKVFVYDAIECLMEDLKSRPLRSGEALFVSDWSRPETGVMDANAGFFLKGGHIPSPMGSSLAAFQSRDSALAYQGRVGGDLLPWSALQKL